MQVHLIIYYKCVTFILSKYYKSITNEKTNARGGTTLRKRTLTLIFSILFTAFTLTGCGENETTDQLKSYQASMTTFCDNISYINDQINGLDGTGESDVEELLKNLDTLNEQFSQMAELTVPEEFATAENLADEASENMSMAVSYYHQAYEAETFNQNYADAAYEYYTRANTRLGYILQILHGEEILDENVKYIVDDSDSEE